MLSIFGFSLITVLCYLLLSSCCVRYETIEHSYRDILILLNVIKEKISAHSMPLSAIMNLSIDLPYLSEIGFIESVREEGFLNALESNRDKMIVDEQDYELLLNYFRSFGLSTRSHELENLCSTIKELERKYEQTKSLTSQRKKVSGTLIVCSYLILIIFLI